MSTTIDLEHWVLCSAYSSWILSCFTSPKIKRKHIFPWITNNSQTKSPEPFFATWRENYFGSCLQVYIFLIFVFFHLYLGQVHMVHEYLTFSVVIQSPSYPSENNLFTWPTYIFALFNKFMFHALLGPLLSVSYFIVSRGMVCLAHY